MTRKAIIGVIGGANPSEKGRDLAYDVGRLVAQHGAVLVCGGLGGVMASASQGCAEAGGDVIGILPGGSADSANPYVTLPIATNMGHARNVIIAHTADVLIAIEGGHGTVSEIAISLKLGKTVVQLNRDRVFSETVMAVNAEQAVELALQALEDG